jgi:anti-sigma28 factor (negative regulator of flagellin synthesis)
MDKVEELKAQIEKGTYEGDPEEIAKKMLEESLFNDMV